MDVDPGASTNRTVYTFVGTPDRIIDGALNAAKAAFPLIDMTKHKVDFRSKKKPRLLHIA